MVDLDFKGLSELKGTGAPIRKQPAESSELQKAADEAKSKIETAADVLKQYQAASILTSKLQSEILIGVRQGENIYTLFLKAVKALSLDTGNRLLYDQIEQDILAIYGVGLQDQEPLEIELSRARERLEKLQQAERSEIQADAKERIQAAIRAHKKHIEQLESRK